LPWRASSWPIASTSSPSSRSGTKLRYGYEIRKASDYFSDIGTPKVTREMVQLAEHILASKAAKFDPSRFEDRYEAALKALVKRKAAGKTIEAAQPPTRKSNVVNLMAALKRSLKSGKAERPRRRRTKARPKKAARRRAA
jgi:DNA end-binding protein Ku